MLRNYLIIHSLLWIGFVFWWISGAKEKHFISKAVQFAYYVTAPLICMIPVLGDIVMVSSMAINYLKAGKEKDE